jgi:Family of unknown function (DUF5522)
MALKLVLNKKSKSNNSKTKDFYINENGFMVFTEKYHLERGYCCKNNCLHCPYQTES